MFLKGEGPELPEPLGFETQKERENHNIKEEVETQKREGMKPDKVQDA